MVVLHYLGVGTGVKGAAPFPRVPGSVLGPASILGQDGRSEFQSHPFY